MLACLELTDISMPRMDGYMVARELRKLPETRAATFAALTGWGQKGDHQRSLDAGFDEHIVKPVEIQVLQRLMIAAREKTRTDDRGSFRPN
jgi:CheY-like chemotaxis protein